MSVRNLLPVMGILLVALAGCNRETATRATATPPKSFGGVGVVDLDSVAKQLGRDREMKTLVQERLSSLNNKLTTFKNSLDRLYEEKRAGFGEDPNEEQQKQLSTMQER